MPQPLDLAKCKNLLSIYQASGGGIYSDVLGPIIGGLSEQLEAAIASIKDADARVSAANLARDKADAALETAQQTISRMRNGSSGMKDLVDALTAISINPKGAAKVAAAALAKVNGNET